MRTITKIFLTIILFILLTVIGGAIRVGMGGGAGVFTVILIIGFIGAVRGIWKYNSEPEKTGDTTADNQDLNKS